MCMHTYVYCIYFTVYENIFQTIGSLTVVSSKDTKIDEII